MYTIQTRSVDGSPQPVEDDVFKLTATSVDAEPEVTYTASVSANTSGLYTATFTPT